MNFTRQQMQAIWFIVALIGLATGYRLYQYLVWEPSKFDFSKIDAEYSAIYDSIKTAERLPDSRQLQTADRKKTTAAQSKIEINTATAGQLIRLPRIGPKTAAKIIEYRQQNGPFKNIREIMNVKGIGKKTFENMKSHIYIKSR